jgi:hypothetical protein
MELVSGYYDDSTGRKRVGDAAAKLISYMSDASGFDVPFAEIRDLQVRAMDERLHVQGIGIRLVKHRAEEAGIGDIRSFEDVVPLLLPHTAYKSYPESFLSDKRWDRLTKWLATTYSLPLDNVELEGIEDIEEWIERLGAAGHHLSCSSGTTGKSAMLLATEGDIRVAAETAITAVEWGSDMRRGDMRSFISSGGSGASTRRAVLAGTAMMEAFVDPSKPRPASNAKPITIGRIARMIALRKSVADGTAKPNEIAAYEAESAERQRDLDNARISAADDVIAKRHDRLFIPGMWGSIYQLAKEVRDRGYSARDFHPENGLYLAGGLKRAALPPDFKEFVYDTFNIQPRFIHQIYSMQEIVTGMVRCQGGGRYHIPPWLVCLPLDKAGEKLLPGVGDASVEGRAAFFDLSMEGRWGGVISGDHIQVDYGPCNCGSKSPSIREDIYRYADLQGDDKIACSGTVDAYVRGVV